MPRTLMRLLVVALLLLPTQLAAQPETLVLPKEVSVYPAMSTQLPPHTALAKGVTVSILTRRPDWLFIEYSGGKKGYVQIADLVGFIKGLCADSLYLQLKKKDVNGMTEREWTYFQEQHRACLASAQDTLPRGSSAPARAATTSGADRQTQSPPTGASNGTETTRAQLGTPFRSRRGFWLNIGGGYGNLGCAECSERFNGISGGLTLGTTLSQYVLLGASVNGWTKTDAGISLTAGSATTAIRVYPDGDAGFFLLAGLGLGKVDISVGGVGSDSGLGYAGLIGLGYDIRFGSMVSLTPFWNGIAIKQDDGDVNFAQVGLSFTIH